MNDQDDPHDYDATAQEILKDPVAKAAYDERERMRKLQWDHVCPEGLAWQLRKTDDDEPVELWVLVTAGAAHLELVTNATRALCNARNVVEGRLVPSSGRNDVYRNGAGERWPWWAAPEPLDDPMTICELGFSDEARDEAYGPGWADEPSEGWTTAQACDHAWRLHREIIARSGAEIVTHCIACDAMGQQMLDLQADCIKETRAAILLRNEIVLLRDEIFGLRMQIADGEQAGADNHESLSRIIGQRSRVVEELRVALQDLCDHADQAEGDARVLAHAYTNDNRPPPIVVERAIIYQAGRGGGWRTRLEALLKKDPA